MRAYSGNRGIAAVPVHATPTIVASGTARAMKPTPLRARSARPSERVPSGQIRHAPLRSSSIARSSAPLSPDPRSIGIWPIPVRTEPSTLFFHIEDFANALICRRGMAAIPVATVSQ